MLQPKRGYTEAQKEQILAAYNERSSMRGIQRTFGVSRNTLASWLKKDAHNPKLHETLLPAQAEDVLEADEMWFFVLERWIWTVMCRRTCQIMAYVIGDRNGKTLHYRQAFWNQIPEEYKCCHSYSDFWEAYQLVFPPETHECVGKGCG